MSGNRTPPAGAGPCRSRDDAWVKLGRGPREVCWVTDCGRQPAVAVRWLTELFVWVCARHEPPTGHGEGWHG